MKKVSAALERYISCPNGSPRLLWRALSQQLHGHACTLQHYPCIETRADTLPFAHSTQFGILASEHVLFYRLWHLCITNKRRNMAVFIIISRSGSVKKAVEVSCLLVLSRFRRTQAVDMSWWRKLGELDKTALKAVTKAIKAKCQWHRFVAVCCPWLMCLTCLCVNEKWHDIFLCVCFEMFSWLFQALSRRIRAALLETNGEDTSCWCFPSVHLCVCVCVIREEAEVEAMQSKLENTIRQARDVETCSIVFSQLLRTTEHAQLSPFAPHVSKNIPGLLLSAAEHTEWWMLCYREVHKRPRE